MRFTIVILSALLCFSAYAEPTEKDSDDALVAAAEKLVTEGGKLKEEGLKTEAVDGASATASEQKTVAAAIADDVKKEAETPVFVKSEKLVKSENSLIWRLVASLAFIAVVSGVLIFAGKRWGRKKNKGGDKVRIEILHQYHMGPKKSIALIRVAGEALLVGCTDQSINLLKTVTLIDDELEGILGRKDFNGFLEDDFSVENMRTALNPRV